MSKFYSFQFEKVTLTPMNLTSDNAKVEYKMMAKYVFCLFVKVAWSASGSLLGNPLMFSIAITKPALLNIQHATNLVRKVLFWSSGVGFSGTSFTSSFVIARVTVSLNAESTSSCGLTVSTTAGESSPDFLDLTEGRASSLSLPLVPQDTCEREISTTSVTG
jgi:hypothetical protein